MSPNMTASVQVDRTGQRDWYVGLEYPTHVPSWEDAAADALLSIAARRVVALSGDASASLRLIEMLLADMKSEVNSDNWNLSDLLESLVLIGGEAMNHVRYEPYEIVEILANKQAAYGSGNILAFGLAGIHVRVSDKVNRLRNLIDKSRADLSMGSLVEPLADSWLDLVGYAVIALMLDKDTFQQPLERDKPTPESIADEAAAEVRRQILEALS